MSFQQVSMQIVWLGLLLFLTSFSVHADNLKEVERPNIVIIYADDLGYGDVRCYNPERGKILTPHIDRLASRGMRFTDGHSSSGVCSPSRYTLLTGRYHWRTKLQSGIVNLWGETLIAAERSTVATLAKDKGYRTACIGKWHLGWSWPIPHEKAAVFKERPTGEVAASDAQREVWREVFSQVISDGPTTRGFEYYFGTDVPNWPPFCFIENDRTLGVPSEFLPSRMLGNNQASNQGPSLRDWKLENVLPTLEQKAVQFITESAKSDNPFFLYLPLTSPHTPLAVNSPWKGKSNLNLYADFVMETDSTVGRVLEAIEQSGQADNTLIVFTSDNGCAPYIGMSELEKLGHSSSGPLRGAKADAWEGGHRVPFIICWPRRVKQGVVCHQLVHQADLFRTIAEILETRLPDNAGEDSFSLLPLLNGVDQPIRALAVSASVNGVPALRHHHWKYIAASGSGGWGKGGDSTLPIQLYDLEKDLGETKNLAVKMPQKVEEMQRLLEQIISQGRSTPGPMQKNDVRVKRFPAQTAPAKK